MEMSAQLHDPAALTTGKKTPGTHLIMAGPAGPTPGLNLLDSPRLETWIAHATA